MMLILRVLVTRTVLIVIILAVVVAEMVLRMMPVLVVGILFTLVVVVVAGRVSILLLSLFLLPSPSITSTNRHYSTVPSHPTTASLSSCPPAPLQQYRPNPNIHNTHHPRDTLPPPHLPIYPPTTPNNPQPPSH